MSERIMAGDIVAHFKRELIPRYPPSTKFIYRVITTDAIDTATEGRVVIYMALYDDHKFFTRPYDDFMAEVDRKKYPNIRQKYRFERVLTDDKVR